jgi:hypothetical protein
MSQRCPVVLFVLLALAAAVPARAETDAPAIPQTTAPGGGDAAMPAAPPATGAVPLPDRPGTADGPGTSLPSGAFTTGRPEAPSGSSTSDSATPVPPPLPP